MGVIISLHAENPAWTERETGRFRQRFMEKYMMRPIYQAMTNEIC